jgi:signal transduction histidine kinase
LTKKFGSFDDEAGVERHFASVPAATLPQCWYWIRKLQARFFAGDYDAALDASAKAQQLLWTSPSIFETAEYHFYSALSHAASCDSAFPDRQHLSSEALAKEEHLKALAAHHRQLEIWAENCPENFENRVALVGAEIERVQGQPLKAEHLYERAIRSAFENGFVHNEALANELAAQFYLKRGIEKVAHSYLRDARYCYLRWGALGKVKQLDERYPAIEDQAAVRPSTSIGTSVEQLDLETVMKASQAVAGEIVLEKLIETLLVIAVEHAGAERGLLILPRGEEHRIEAEARTGRDKVEVQLGQRLVTTAELPESLLRYVVRTQESVILDDASVQNRFSEDDYLRQRRSRSVLCLPLVKQAKLIGVLYLENSLAPRVFTPKRLAMLELLASQAAISFDHAQLYADLRRSEAFLAQGQKISHTGSWGWHVSTGEVYGSKELFRIFNYDPQTAEPSYSLFMKRVHPEDRFSFEEILNRAVRDKSDFEYDYRIVLPDRSTKFLRSVGQALVNSSGELEFIGTVMDITDLKRAEEMRAAMARERELFAQQRATELAKANEALRECLDALASVPELDDFLGQVMAAITGQLGAVASTLRVLNLKQNTLTLELLFQNGRVMSPAEAKFPESWRSLSLHEQRAAAFLDQPTTVARLLDPHSPIPEALRFYLLGLGIKTLLIIPLSLGGQANGQLSFRFTEERDFQAEELEIARALATQASLAIQLTQLAKTARQSAVLEERNRLASEIHDSLAQNFAGISMQLFAAAEAMQMKSKDAFSHVGRATDLARFGLSEARRSALSLRSDIIEESGLIEALKRLVERSNIPGLLRCSFRSSKVCEESLAPWVQQDLLRITQEAISNALRHARPTVISVSLRRIPPNLVLKIRDNGSGIAGSRRISGGEGFGFGNMRARAKNIGAELDIRSSAGSGTSVVVRLPIIS